MLTLQKPLSRLSFDEITKLMTKAFETPQAAREFVEAINREPEAFDQFSLLERMDLGQVYGDLITRSTQPR